MCRLADIVLVDGCFDPLHDGHIDYFKAASEFGLSVVCSCQTDAYIRRVKKRDPLLSELQRLKVLESIRYISRVVLIEIDTANVLRSIKPKVYFKGADWRLVGLPEVELATCESLGIEVCFGEENKNSSTALVEKFFGRAVGFPVNQAGRSER